MASSALFNKIPAHCTKRMLQLNLTCAEREIMDFIALGQYDHRREDLPNVSISFIARSIRRSERHTARALSRLKAMSLLVVVESDNKLGDKLAWNENTAQWRSKRSVGGDTGVTSDSERGDTGVTSVLTQESPSSRLQSHLSYDSPVTFEVTPVSPIKNREEDLRSEDANAYAGRNITYPTIDKSFEEPDQEQASHELSPAGLWLYQEIGASMEQAKAWERPDNSITWGCVFRLRALYLIVSKREGVHSVSATIKSILKSGMLYPAYADKIGTLTAECECSGHQARLRLATQPAGKPTWWLNYAQ